MSAGTITGIRRAVNQRMRHRCTVVRPSGAHSWDSEGSDTRVLSDQPCHYTPASSRETYDGGQRIVTKATLMLPAGTDVRDTARITAIVDQLGTALITEARSVDGPPKRYASHIVVELTGSGA